MLSVPLSSSSSSSDQVSLHDALNHPAHSPAPSPVAAPQLKRRNEEEGQKRMATLQSGHGGLE